MVHTLKKAGSLFQDPRFRVIWMQTYYFHNQIKRWSVRCDLYHCSTNRTYRRHIKASRMAKYPIVIDKKQLNYTSSEALFSFISVGRRNCDHSLNIQAALLVVEWMDTDLLTEVEGETMGGTIKCPEASSWVWGKHSSSSGSTGLPGPQPSVTGLGMGDSLMIKLGTSELFSSANGICNFGGCVEQ